MNFNFFTNNAPLMNKDNLDKLHQLVFRDEGAKFFSTLMFRLPVLSSSIYVFYKNDLASGTHEISGSIPYGISHLNFELQCHWNDDKTPVCIIKLDFNYHMSIDDMESAWASEEVSMETLFNPEKLNEQIDNLRRKHLPDLTLTY